MQSVQLPHGEDPLVQYQLHHLATKGTVAKISGLIKELGLNRRGAAVPHDLTQDQRSKLEQCRSEKEQADALYSTITQNLSDEIPSAHTKELGAWKKTIASLDAKLDKFSSLIPEEEEPKRGQKRITTEEPPAEPEAHSQIEEAAQAVVAIVPEGQAREISPQEVQRKRRKIKGAVVTPMAVGVAGAADMGLGWFSVAPGLAATGTLIAFGPPAALGAEVAYRAPEWTFRQRVAAGALGAAAASGVGYGLVASAAFPPAAPLVIGIGLTAFFGGAIGGAGLAAPQGVPQRSLFLSQARELAARHLRRAAGPLGRGMKGAAGYAATGMKNIGGMVMKKFRRQK